MAQTAGASEITRLEICLFTLGLLVYAATRFVRLSDFPIFFFTDEAIQANTAQSLFLRHFRDSWGVFLPPYFLNDQRWAMSLNIYILVAPIVLFGKTILATRGAFAAVNVLGAAAVGGALQVLGSRGWWAAPLLLAAMPVDFLHSRVAFETTPACFAAFLFAYLLYRLRSPRYVFAAILLGAATFYSYTAGQGIMLVMGVLLLVVDFQYHRRVFRQSSALLAGALLVLALTAIPFLREQKRHPRSTRDQLTVLNSYWVTPKPLHQKLAIFGRRYLQAFRPGYWFRPNPPEAVRHLMKDMAYVPPVYLPLMLLGMAGAVASARRSPGHCVILLSPLSVPFAAAAGDLQILRVLPMVVPITLLTALGIGEVLQGFPRRIARALLPACGAAALAIAAGTMTRTALAKGPTWFRDYTLYGLQYGARQVFQGVREVLGRSNDTRVHVSSIWANNPEPFLDFFLTPGERPRVDILDIDGHLLHRLPVSDNELFVMSADQYKKAQASGKLVLQAPEYTVPWPDGRIGFYFARVRYSEKADAILAAEREARKTLVTDEASINGDWVVVRHSPLDFGTIAEVFDGRSDTLARGMEANPFILEIEFPSPRRISKMRLLLGAMDAVRMRLVVTPGQVREPVSYEETYVNFRAKPQIDFAFPGGSVNASRIRIEIFDLGAAEISHVHLVELSFQ